MMIGYARVSTADQNLDLQTDALKAAGCGQIFTDAGSGARADRRGLGDALGYLRERDILAVWKLDRLGRTVRQLVDLVGELKARGVAFRSLTDGIDTTTPAGRFFFHMMAVLAEMERDPIRERTVAGLLAARARGRLGGRRSLLSDQQLVQAQLLMAHPEQTMAAIAKSLGVSRSTLYRSLARADPNSVLGR